MIYLAQRSKAGLIRCWTASGSRVLPVQVEAVKAISSQIANRVSYEVLPLYCRRYLFKNA